MSLALHSVTIALHDRVLVPPLSATVADGEVLVVMGASGSGKSSLLSYLAGLLVPPLQGAGRVLLGGRDITPLPVEQRRVGLLFQDDLLFPHLSVRDNLLFALPAGRRADRLAAAEAAIAEAELPGLGDRRPSQLSGGQRARVSLLRALLADPQALLLDEPFSKLDTALRERMREFTWRELRQRAVPAVLVTHDRDDAPAGATVVELPPHA
ncbi:MAG: ATP-binding cassette domain-containing protein [Rubrivivax sp.]|nr:ATP-binding cassette domain-containing protein [Rubrivivax sp.]MDH5338285.1 ATP-binding cassette domain-containing protein [Rubrivivax sp.]